MPTPEKIEVKFAIAPSHTGSALAQFAPLAMDAEEYTDWKTGTVHLLEVSDKVPTGEAKAFAAALGAHMQVLGLPQLDGSKTEFALENSGFRLLAQPAFT